MDFNEQWADTVSTVSLACRAGDASAIETLLKAGRSVNVSDNRGWRPLHEAAHAGHLDCIRLLCENEDNDVNWTTFEGETSLVLAARAGHVDVCKFLVEKGVSLLSTDTISNSPLMEAIESGNLDCAKILTIAGSDIECPDVDCFTALHVAVENGHLNIMNWLLQEGALLNKRDDYGRTAIFISAERNNAEFLHGLLEEAKKRNVLHEVIDLPTDDGTTPLMIAAQGGLYDNVKRLVDNGANVNTVAEDYSMALHLAVFGKSLECIRLLLDKTDRRILRTVTWQPECRQIYDNVHNSNPKCCQCWACKDDEGQPSRPRNFDLSKLRSPFHLAVNGKTTDILQCLLDSDLDPNEFICAFSPTKSRCRLVLFTDSRVKLFGMTALGLATIKKDIEKMKLLIKSGCSFTSDIEHVIPPLAFALRFKFHDGIRLLLDCGSDPNFPMKTNIAIFSLLEFLAPVFDDDTGRNKALLELRRAGGDMRLIFDKLSGEQFQPFLLVLNSLMTKMQQCKKQSDGLDFNSQLLDSLGFDLYNVLKRFDRNELVDKIRSDRPLMPLGQMCAIIIRNKILDSRKSSEFLKSIMSLELPSHLADYVALRSSILK